MQCRGCRSFQCKDAMDMNYVDPSDGKTLYDYFNDCTQLEATSEDELPKILCLDCTQSLQLAYKFREKVRRSDEELKKFLAINKREEFINDYVPIQSELFEAIEGSTNQLLSVLTKTEAAFAYYPEQSTVLGNNKETSTTDPLYAPGYSEQNAHKPCSSTGEQQLVKKEIKTEDTNDELEDSDQCNFEQPKPDELEDNSDGYETKHYRLTYKCDICVYKCGTKTKLKTHIFKIHKETIVCHKCCKVFDVPAEMEMHQKLVHSTDTDICCPWCKNSSNILPKAELAKHLQKRHNGAYFKYFPRRRMLKRCEDDPYQCEQCQKMFSSIEELANHVRGHTFDCPLCSMSFKKTATYRIHLKRIHNHSLTSLKALLTAAENDENNITYKCDLCEKQLKSKDTLRRHMKSKHKESTLSGVKGNTKKSSVDAASKEQTGAAEVQESPTMPEVENDSDELVDCKLCPKKIPARLMKQHERQHAYRLNQLRHSICSFCSREFKSISAVREHERKMHLRPKERKECPVCHKQVDCRNFNAHMSYVHKRERNFPCDICGDLFKSSNQAMIHKQLHFDRKYTCSICNKGFIRQCDLKVHMRIHTGEEPYACHICERRFRYKVQLNYHLQRHAGIKRKCNVCGKEFNHIKHLRNHSYKHTGMPYRCTVCKYACAQRGVFKTHILRMHDMTMTDDEYRAMFKANTGRNPRVKTSDELQLE